MSKALSTDLWSVRYQFEFHFHGKNEHCRRLLAEQADLGYGNQI